jgi:hypothetical protein
VFRQAPLITLPDIVLALLRAAGEQPAREAPARLHGVPPEGCRAIALSRGLVAIVDAADFDALCERPWYAKPARNGSKSFYACSGGEMMHRVLMRAPAGLVVDHWNGDGLDNRRANLRLCGQRENVINRRVKNRSGYRGVQRTSSGSWRARISIDGQWRHIGTYPDAVSAARAYDEAALALHGAFAVTNFVSISGTSDFAKSENAVVKSETALNDHAK